MCSRRQIPGVDCVVVCEIVCTSTKSCCGRLYSCFWGRICRSFYLCEFVCFPLKKTSTSAKTRVNQYEHESWGVGRAMNDRVENRLLIIW